jgi:hypothetical protein
MRYGAVEARGTQVSRWTSQSGQESQQCSIPRRHGPDGATGRNASASIFVRGVSVHEGVHPIREKDDKTSESSLRNVVFLNKK